MNLNINPQLTSTIAADRIRSYALQAEISRIRKSGRSSRQAACSAPAPRAAAGLSLVGRPASIPASSDVEHASARIA